MMMMTTTMTTTSLFPLPTVVAPPPEKFINLSRKIAEKNPNFEAFKDRLIRLSNSGRIKQAISTLDLMTQTGLTPDLTTYYVLLKSCIRTRNFHLGKLVHQKLNHSGLEFDSVVLNSLISLYSKCGDWVTAKTIFDNMGETGNGKRDLVSWSAMISCFAHNGMEAKALSTFIRMLCDGEEYPNQYCFSAAIQACGNNKNGENSETGKAIFGFVIKTGYLGSDVCVGCALIDMFAKGIGDLRSARRVFDKMPERNSVAWTLLITRYAQLGDPKDGISLFLDMLSSNEVMPDRFTLTSVISACAELGLVSVGQQLHSWVVKSPGLCSDVCVGCSLVDMYAKCAINGSVEDAMKVFEQMPDHNVMSWTAIIAGHVQSGGLDRIAIELYHRMVTEGRVSPNHFTLSSLIKACGSLSDMKIGEQVHNHAVKLGLASVNCVGNSLISMYARSGRMEDARRAFEVLFEKNLVSYNSIVDGYVKNSDSDKAFEVFNELEDAGTGVDAFTFASLLSGAATLGELSKGEAIHGRLVKHGLESNQAICNALISMYSRCGNIEASFHVFNKMEDRNVISWTAMITGFAKHGLAREALQTFDHMLEAGLKPNEVTYVAVLSAISHVGMVSEGLKHFDSMYMKHNIKPRMEHYACVVDLLGRSGYLEKAVDFINSMPFKADALVWRTLLGACQVHRNVELGKLAAKMIVEQDAKDPAAYILLSNLYAWKGEWEEVVAIRKCMKERNLVKEAGCSWLETGNRVHKFYVGDTYHPQADEIYEQLDRLVAKIKEIGYVPDTDFVLHDVENDLKEQYLLQHSEKIAVAFGLINTPNPKPIRIFKNLRVCGDCHNAMKYVSVATGREILVRDSNRFHRFKDGSCSCNDYW